MFQFFIKIISPYVLDMAVSDYENNLSLLGCFPCCNGFKVLRWFSVMQTGLLYFGYLDNI